MSPFILSPRFLSMTLVTLKAPQELIAKYPRASVVASKLIALESLCLAVQERKKRKKRRHSQAHSRHLVLGFTVYLATTQQKSSPRPSVDTKYLHTAMVWGAEGGVGGERGQADDKGCLVRPVYTLSYFGRAFTVDWAHKLSLYPAFTNSTVKPPPPSPPPNNECTLWGKLP